MHVQFKYFMNWMFHVMFIEFLWMGMVSKWLWQTVSNRTHYAGLAWECLFHFSVHCTTKPNQYCNLKVYFKFLTQLFETNCLFFLCSTQSSPTTHITPAEQSAHTAVGIAEEIVLDRQGYITQVGAYISDVTENHPQQCKALRVSSKALYQMQSILINCLSVLLEIRFRWLLNQQPCDYRSVFLPSKPSYSLIDTCCRQRFSIRFDYLNLNIHSFGLFPFCIPYQIFTTTNNMLLGVELIKFNLYPHF